MLLIGVWADVVSNVLTNVMVGVGVDVMVGVVAASVVIVLELTNPSSYAVALAHDWDEPVISIDLSTDMRVGELIDVLARV